MKVLLVATYELGQQPVGIAGLASCLLTAGHDVSAVDLSVEPWPRDADSVDAIVFSVPMHTATELALQCAARLDSAPRRPRIAFVGLYAGVLMHEGILRPGDLVAAGDAARAVLEWLDVGDPLATPSYRLDLGPARSEPAPLPARHLLPPLGSYARFIDGEREVPAAGVEASRGCNHTCRHCPVAAVYGGRSRAVRSEDVMADVAQAVEAGARHVSFVDPDFLNRPAHARAIAAAVARRFNSVTFDATVKVEHVLRHRNLWPELAQQGLRFIVSAFESRDDRVLALLDKGHDASEEWEAVSVLRAAGVEVRPSWLPFTPWSTLESVAAILDFSARADLVASTDPVQYTIRLLLPPGSLLLEDPDPVLAASLQATGPPRLVCWKHHDTRLDDLQSEMAAVAEEDGVNFESAFSRLWRLCRNAGATLPELPPEPELVSPFPPSGRPRLSEPWFCCAEPTGSQLELVWR